MLAGAERIRVSPSSPATARGRSQRSKVAGGTAAARRGTAASQASTASDEGPELNRSRAIRASSSATATRSRRRREPFLTLLRLTSIGTGSIPPRRGGSGGVPTSPLISSVDESGQLRTLADTGSANRLP